MAMTHESVKNGLVLGGGGSRGCYEIGAWRAFEENNVAFDAVSGVSIGAIVGAMYVQGALEQMENFVKELTPQKIAAGFFKWPTSPEHLFHSFKEISSFAKKTVLKGEQMDIAPLMANLEAMFDYQAFHDSPIRYACLTYNLTLNRPQPFYKKDMTAQNALSILIASASCYPAFPIHEMDGMEYIDGGYGNNLPVQLCLDLGASRILAIDVEGPGMMPKQPECDLFLVKPILHLANFLDFSSDSALLMERIGYLEMSRLLGRFTGFFFTFDDPRGAIGALNEVLHFFFELNHLEMNEAGLVKGLQSLYFFSDSDLAQALAARNPWFTLVEGLGMLCGMDPYPVYSLVGWMKILLPRLNSLHVPDKMDGQNDFARWFQGLSAKEKTAGIHYLMKRADTVLFRGVELCFSLFPIECDLAAAWYYVEKMYGREQNEETDQPASGAEAGA